MQGASNDDYNTALNILSSLQRTPSQDACERQHRLAPRYLKALRLTEEDIARLPVIHVSGTRGKDITCAMLERILRAAGYRTGLFASPHLCDIRERVRIDGVKVDKETFARAVLWLHDRFREADQSEQLPMPSTFGFLTFLTLHLFLQQQLDVVVLQVGIGGRLDPTNIVPSPVICGITSIGYDHTELLGTTLQEIASEVAGIFKQKAMVFTVPQYSEAQQTLEYCAARMMIPLIDVGQAAAFRNFYEIQNSSVAKGGLANYAVLAVHIAQAFEGASWRRPMRPELRQKHNDYVDRMQLLKRYYLLPKPYLTALSEFEWPGRLQKLRDVDLRPLKGQTNLTFYLDRAYTAEGIAACFNWFANETSQLPSPVRLLLFNSPRDRNPEPLIRAMVSSMKTCGISFRHVFFVPSLTEQISPFRRCQHQKRQLQLWLTLLEKDKPSTSGLLDQQASSHTFLRTSALKNRSGNIQADVFPSLLSSLGWFRSLAHERSHLDIHLLITGSLSLVGDVLKLLGKATK